MARNNVISMKADEVRSIRQRLGMNQKEFAKFLGVTFQAVDHWEESRRVMPEVTAKIVRFFSKYPHLTGYYL